MKVKNILLLTILFVLISGYLSAQTNVPKFYSDNRNDFSGLSVAVYFSEEQYDNASLKLMEVGNAVSKITRNNYWLCEQALNEWDTEPGEFYMIVCVDNVQSENMLVVLAMIEEDGESFDWWARTLTLEELESFSS